MNRSTGAVCLLACMLLALTGGASAYRQQLSDFDTDVQAIVNGLTLQQKIGQMTQLDIRLFGSIVGSEFVLNETTLNITFDRYMIGSILNTPIDPGVPELSQLSVYQLSKMHTRLQQIATDRGSKLPIVYGLDSVHGANYVRGAALFPQSIGMAATFNVELMTKGGQTTAKDTRATGIPWVFAPILGIAVQPSWPRVYETFGEDPYLAAAMGVAAITGMQGGAGQSANLSSPYRVAACMKHFVGYSDPRSGHDRTPAWISDRFLHQYFLPSFRAAVQKADVATAMESYHTINGVPVVSSRQYLIDILRTELDFDGMLVTDYAEIERLFSDHFAVPTPIDAVRVVLQETSVDMSMVATDNSFPPFVESLVTSNLVDTSRIDVSCARVVQLKKNLGLLANPYGPALDSAQVQSVGSHADREAARQAARESIILLKNQNNFLPLGTVASSGAVQRRILFVGPSCNSLRRQCGGWTMHWQGSEEWEFPYGSTILNATRRLLAPFPGVSISHVWGGVDFDGVITNQTDYNLAISEARNADVVIACTGEDAYAEKPGDINDLTLPANMRKLVTDVSATGTPTVVVLLEGRPRIVTDVVASATAVLYAMLPGPEGGDAIAEILFGLTNPSGRLPLSYPQFPAATLAPYWHAISQEPVFPLYEFGYGLSYTNFTYSAITIAGGSATPNVISDAAVPLTIGVTVTNIGPAAGKETVLLFVGDDYRVVEPERMLLKGFQKSNVLPVGGTQTFTFTLAADDVAFYGLQNERRTEDGTFTVTIPSSNPYQTAKTAAFSLAIGNPSPAPPTCDQSGTCAVRSTGALVGAIIGSFAAGALAVIVFRRLVPSPLTSVNSNSYNNM